MATLSRSAAPAPTSGFDGERAPTVALGGVGLLAWVAISIPIVSGARPNEAEAIALLIFVIAIPAAAVAGLLELGLALRRSTTELAVIASISGALGGWLAAVLVVGSMQAPAEAGAGGVFMTEGLLLTIVSLGQLVLAARLLPGRWRLIPLGAALVAVLAAGPAAGQALGPPETGTWLSRPGSGWATAAGAGDRIWAGAVECHWRHGYDLGVASVSGFAVELRGSDRWIHQIGLDQRQGVGSNATILVALGGGSYANVPGQVTAVGHEGFDGTVEATANGIVLHWSCPGPNARREPRIPSTGSASR